MKVQGMLDPGSFSVECIPGTNRSFIRLYQNITPCHKEDFEGYEYDEYHVEVETWDGVAKNVEDNYNEFLRQGMSNEIDRSNEALRKAQEELDEQSSLALELAADHEERLCLLEIMA